LNSAARLGHGVSFRRKVAHLPRDPTPTYGGAMKHLFRCLSALLVLGAGASLAHAQYPFPVRPAPVYCPAPPLRAPDFCGGNYYVYPPFPPFQGMLPVPQNAQAQQGGTIFGHHAFIRSPRDFYMVD
jgi:hypothetical protein